MLESEGRDITILICFFQAVVLFIYSVLTNEDNDCFNEVQDKQFTNYSVQGLLIMVMALYLFLERINKIERSICTSTYAKLFVYLTLTASTISFFWPVIQKINTCNIQSWHELIHDNSVKLAIIDILIVTTTCISFWCNNNANYRHNTQQFSSCSMEV